MTEFQNSIDRALYICRLWLHLGFIGAAALVAGLLELFHEQTKWPWALALACFGFVLAAASWLRGLAVLEDAEWMSTVVTDASGDSTSPASRKEIGHGATGVSSPIPPQTHRRHDHGLRRPTPG